MKITEIKDALASLSAKIISLSESEEKQTLLQLLNLVELLVAENERLKDENQKLRDENNRLKGEQGKPEIRAQTKNSGDISSEQERKPSAKKKKKKQRRKKSELKVTRTEICEVEKSELPEDVQFKGYDQTIVQDIRVLVDVICFKKEVYYSPSSKKRFQASLPPGYEGSFGPHLKSLILGLKHICQMSEPKILEFLTDHGVRIAASTLSEILSNQEWAHEEKEAIFRAGLSSSVYQHIDDTQARVNGKNQHTHILCNEFYTAFFTTEHKNRLSVLSILRGGKPESFLLNKGFISLLESLNLAKKWIRLMSQNLSESILSRGQMETLLTTLSERTKMGERVQKRILEAAAIAAYQQQEDRIPLLVCDDAPQFKLLSAALALCWIHEGRHYKKLSPVVPIHQEILSTFLDDFWNYYHRLLEFKDSPTGVLALQLEKQFEELFSLQTGYEELDHRISRTFAKKEELLQVLPFPQVPLHNNPAELGARSAVRRRDVSLHTMTQKGTQYNDSFMTLNETAKKLGVSLSAFIYDRISGERRMPSLAKVIESRFQSSLLNEPIENIPSEKSLSPQNPLSNKHAKPPIGTAKKVAQKILNKAEALFPPLLKFGNTS